MRARRSAPSSPAAPAPALIDIDILVDFLNAVLKLDPPQVEIRNPFNPPGPACPGAALLGKEAGNWTKLPVSLSSPATLAFCTTPP